MIGLLVGLEMLFAGWTWIMLALAIRDIPEKPAHDVAEKMRRVAKRGGFPRGERNNGGPRDFDAAKTYGKEYGSLACGGGPRPE